MAKCVACGSTILFGGKRDGDARYCNEQCHGQGVLLALAGQVPQDVVQKQVREIHGGPCPHCGGNGPVDVHFGYRVWSALLLTSWKSVPHVCCRSCGIKSQSLDTLFSLMLGWWAFPWGFIVTPVQVTRNLLRMVKAPDPMNPSGHLETTVRIALASQVVAAPAPRQEN